MNPQAKKPLQILSLVVIATLSTLAFQNCSQFKSAAQSSDASAGSTLSGDVPVIVNPGQPNAAPQAAAATGGVPKIHQIRNGTEIATFDKLGVAFARTHAFRTYQTGDVYELDAAVYEGDDQQPWIGPMPLDDADYNRGEAQYLVPKDLVLRGRTQNGKRPVIKVPTSGVSYNTYGNGILYVDKSVNLTVENIDFDGGGSQRPTSGKAAIYVNGAQGFTLRNSRVLNFTQSNGVFSTGNNSGLITFENVETGFNGGDSGPEHNYYMGESTVDANHTILWRGCYSHDVYYGHTLKSRAQNNIVEASHLKGKKVSSGQGEAFLADFPNGGRITLKNNILEKDYSGDNSNGIFIGYAMEGQNYPNASSITIVHNTFVAHVQSFDSQGHLLQPMNFYYPAIAPTDAKFPPNVKTVVQANAFAGFNTDPAFNQLPALYRGVDAKIYDLTKFDVNLVLSQKDVSPVSSVGQLQHVDPVGTVARTTSVYGGLD